MQGDRRKQNKKKIRALSQKIQEMKNKIKLKLGILIAHKKVHLSDQEKIKKRWKMY